MARFTLKSLAAVVVLALICQHAQAVEIFKDDFNRNDGAVGNGWIEYENGHSVFANGSEVDFDYNDGPAFSSIRRLVPTTGFTGITVSASGSETGSEDSDTTAIWADYADGNGWQLVTSNPTDPDHNNSSLADDWSPLNGALSVAADNNPYLRIRFSQESNAATNDNTYLDELTLEGTGSAGAQPVLIFADDAEQAPGDKGWSLEGPGGISQSGSEYQLQASESNVGVGGGNNRSALFQTLNTTGYENLAIELEGLFDASDNDFMDFEYSLDDGSTWLSLLGGQLTGGSPTFLDPLIAVGTPTNNSLMLRVWLESNHSNDTLDIDFVNVYGLEATIATPAVPEPMTAGLCLLAIAGLVCRRRSA